MPYIEKSIHGGAVTYKPPSGRFPAGLDITIGRYSVTIRNRKTLNDILRVIDGLTSELGTLDNE